MDEALAFIGTPEQEEIELRVLEIQIEKKEEELARKERESRLKMPFSGEFRYLVKMPENLETPLNMQGGDEIAELRNYGLLECHMVVSRPELRRLPTQNLRLKFAPEGSSVPLEAEFLRKETKEVFGKPELIYVFNFSPALAEQGRVLIGGRLSAELVVKLDAEAILIPKLDLVRADGDAIRKRGWQQGLPEVLPGYRALSVGQSEVAIVKIPAE